jgi:phage tail-like protein
MADSKDVQRKSYPLAAYNFRVSVNGVSMSFTEVSGITVAYDHVTYRHGMSFLEGEAIQTFYFDKFIPITCKRGTILGNQPLFLHEWLNKRDARSMEVSLCDETGAPVLSWKIAAAVPVSLKAPAFTAGTNEAAIDTVELQVRGVSVVTL